MKLTSLSGSHGLAGGEVVDPTASAHAFGASLRHVLYTPRSEPADAQTILPQLLDLRPSELLDLFKRLREVV